MEHSTTALADATEERTRAFLAALARRDLPALEEMLHPQAGLTIALSLTGAPEPAGRFDGKPEVLGYLRGVTEKMDRIRLTDTRVSVTGGGETAFVQADGDFTTADGRPYNNVYILRMDWAEGLLTGIEEYANPITFTQVFGDLAA